MNNALVQKLKVKPITEFLLLPGDIGTSFEFEQWGQHQDVPCRIKEILQDYPEGSIFKEQVQKAKDAGASKVKFFQDEQENLNQTEKLIGPKMKFCNRKTLWVYNDAKFSKEDFKNIIKIGGATKKENFEKIGSFRDWV